MALLNIFRKRGQSKGPIAESNPHSADPMAVFKTDRSTYPFETYSPDHRAAISKLDRRKEHQANETELSHAIAQTYLNPGMEHTDAIFKEANRNIDENRREVDTRDAMLGGASIQNLDRMYKANNAAHRAKQKAAGVPEHDIMDLESGYEVSGDAINRLKNAKPPKLSNK